MVLWHFANTAFEFGTDGVATSRAEEFDLARLVQVFLINLIDTAIEGCPHFELDVVRTQKLEAVLAVFVFVFTGMAQLQNYSIRGWVKAGVDPVNVIVSK